MKHPWWYYKYYDSIFASKRDYRLEVNEIANQVPLNNLSILEIGAGTGLHCEAVLEHLIGNYTAIDTDLSAIKILKEKFCNNKKIEVLLKDGFLWNMPYPKYDLILIMYTVLQQTNKNNFFQRLEVLIRLIEKGSICFEFVDISALKNKINANSNNLFIEDRNKKLYINTNFDKLGATMRIHGIIEKKTVEYIVNIAEISKTELISFALKNGLKLHDIRFPKSDHKRLIILKNE